MPDPFEYISRARLEYRHGYRHAYLGDVPAPVVYGVQGGLREYYGVAEGPPVASTLDHIVAAVAGWMYGTLRGALAGRKIAFDRESFAATVEGRIAGIGKTIHIKSIHVHYDLAVPAEAREATERALAAHPQGCPAHQSVKNAIHVTWSASLKVGDQTLSIREETSEARSS